jgi:DNA-binding transcriptional regulator LsrR (DeoR family)
MEMTVTKEEEQRLIRLRQSRVIELLCQGLNQHAISRELNISEPTISRDIQHLTNESIANIDDFINKKFPLDFERCNIAYNLILRKAFAIVNSPQSKISEQLQVLSLILTTYDKINDMISSRPLANDIIKSYKNKEAKLEEKRIELEQKMQEWEEEKEKEEGEEESGNKNNTEDPNIVT